MCVPIAHMKSKVYLFTSPTCPHCPNAKKFIHEFKKKRDDFVLKEYSTATKEGQKLSAKFQVRSVPTFIIKGPGYAGNIGLVGVQNDKTMNKYLDLSLGKEPEREPSFIERLKSDGIKIGKFKIKI